LVLQLQADTITIEGHNFLPGVSLLKQHIPFRDACSMRKCAQLAIRSRICGFAWEHVSLYRPLHPCVNSNQGPIVHMGVSNCWTGIWTGIVEWTMEFY